MSASESWFSEVLHHSRLLHKYRIEVMHSADRRGVTLIRPLRKRSREGILYTRFPDIQTQLDTLDQLPSQELIERCRVPEKEAGAVPVECVLAFVRREWAAQNHALCEPLLAVLLERLRRRLPRALNLDGKTASLSRSDQAEQVHDTFVAMLIGEANDYDERLDYYEISFSQSIAKLSLTAKRRSRRSIGRQEELYDEDEGELRAEVELAIGVFDPFNPDLLQDEIYRSRLPAAMEKLKPLEKRIVEMWRNDVPIDSKDPSITTMTRITGRSEKGIRNIRDRAFAKLRGLLSPEGEV
ncbi:hypothetical protein FJP65_04220 [Stenotrophomonas maltophilia]|nr:hypothetical protein FJP65_04220 [Stenotrophomonas maltophilia]